MPSPGWPTTLAQGALGWNWPFDLRSFPVGTVVLFYTPTPSGIELVRVLSGYRDIGRDDFDA